jgi:hypothetical protein
MSSSISKPSYKSYDDEFRYDDGQYGGKYHANLDIESNLAATLKRVEEESELAVSSNQSKEEYLRLFEQNVANRQEYHWPNQEELKQQRTGRILHMNEFITKLKAAGLNCWYSDKGGMAKTLGLYVSVNDKTKYIGFVQVPFMQEYEELYFDRYNVPLGPKRRGWRTILLKLIENRILTEAKAHQAFGEPQTGHVSRRYREYLKHIRNTPRS